MLADLRPGDPAVVGPYKLLKRLGQGGMGVVYLARSPGGRQVAVKVIRPEYASDPGFRTRFAREVGAARGVSGMFTALVVDADTDGPTPWLATAYVPGHSLAEAVETHGALPPGSVLQLAAGLAEGLQAIHAAGLVHRDLKPSNVLLAADGPRVIDFGISKARESTMLTQTGMVMGSPGFLSPEQAEGYEVGPPSDVFSLGAVLTYAATGMGPFGSGPTPALMFRVVTRDPDMSGVPESLRPVIERCLAKDPAVRPTPEELLVELDQLGAGVGVLTPEWLPESITSTIARYVSTGLTPAAPAATEVSPPPAQTRVEQASEPVTAADPVHPETIRTTRVPADAAIPAVAAAAVTGGPPGTAGPGGQDTVLVSASGPVPGPAPAPVRAPKPRARRRLLLAAAVAVVLITGLALGLAKSIGGTGKKTDLNYSTTLSGKARPSASHPQVQGSATPATSATSFAPSTSPASAGASASASLSPTAAASAAAPGHTPTATPTPTTTAATPTTPTPTPTPTSPATTPATPTPTTPTPTPTTPTTTPTTPTPTPTTPTPTATSSTPTAPATPTSPSAGAGSGT